MFHMYDFVGMILPLMAASDSCAGRAGITGAWWGGKGGTAASGDSGRGARRRVPVRVRRGHISDSGGWLEQVFPSSLFVIITFRLF